MMWFLTIHLGIYILLTTVLIKVLCDCGITAPNANPSDANEDGTGAKTFPWAVTIFQDFSGRSLWRLCAGSLISRDVVITIEICTSIEGAKLHELYVVAGNYAPVSIPPDRKVHKSGVQALHIESGHDKSNGADTADVTWLVLEHPLNVTPACIDLESQQDTEQLPIGLVGQVVNRPRSDDTARPDIWETEIIDSSNKYCTNILRDAETNNVSRNPSCARLSSGTANTFQIRGGGFYSQQDGRWYLRAIITNVYKPTEEDGDQYYARLMNVQRFVDQIKKTGAIQRCGVAAPPVKSLIINGFRAELGRFPWHVAVYSKDSNGKYTQICAGSLISTNIVISAAHCFYDEVRRQKQDATRFAVAAGKFYRLYDATESFVQKSAVLTIYLPRTYYGAAGNYADDIAWIILQHPFYYSAVVSRVCINADNSRQDGDLHAGQVGKVVGWGRTEAGVLSDELREVNLPFIPYESCSSEIPPEFIPFLTADKFCAGYLNGTALCDGDSGGGLAFYRGGTWYLRGIVSVSPVSSSAGTCPNFYTAFTSVAYHAPEQRRIISLSIQGSN